MPDRPVRLHALGRFLRPGRAAAIAAFLIVPAVGFAAPAYAANEAVSVTLPSSVGVAADPTAFTVDVTPDPAAPPSEIDLAAADSGVVIAAADSSQFSSTNGGKFVFKTPPTTKTPYTFTLEADPNLAGTSETVTAYFMDGTTKVGGDATTTLSAPTVTATGPTGNPTAGDTVTSTLTVTNSTASDYSSGAGLQVPVTITGPGLTPADVSLVAADGTDVALSDNGSGGLTGTYPATGGKALSGGSSTTLTATFTDAAAGDYTVAGEVTLGGTSISRAGNSAQFTVNAVVPPTTVVANVPSDLGAWADPTAFTVTAANLDPATCTNPAYHLHLTGNQSLNAEDVTLQYRDGSGTWRNVTLSATSGDLDGSTPAGSVTASTRFRIVVNAPFDENADDIALALTRLAVTTTVESAGTVCGDATDTDNVKLHLPTLAFNLPDRVHAGASTPFTVTISNNTGSSYSQLADLSLTLLEKDDINPGDITLSYADGNRALPCDAEGLLVCDLTNGKPFTLANGQAISQKLQMTIAKRVRNQQLLMVAEVGQITPNGQALADHVDLSSIVGSSAQGRPVTGGVTGTGSTTPGSSSGSGGTLALTGAPTLVPTVLTGVLLLVAGGGLLAFGAAGRRREETEPTA